MIWKFTEGHFVSCSTRMMSWSVPIACLLVLLTVCHGRLYVSSDGSSSSDCTTASPCSIARALQRFNQTPTATFELYLAPGNYEGVSNTNIELPTGVSSFIEKWDAKDGIVHFTVSSGTLFATSDDLTLNNIQISVCENCSAITVDDGSALQMNLNGCTMNGTDFEVLVVSSTRPGQLGGLRVDSCYLEGALHMVEGYLILRHSVVAGSRSSSVYSASITDCYFAGSDFHFAGTNLFISQSRFKTMGGHDLTVLVTSEYVEMHDVTFVNYSFSVLDCQSVVADDIFMDSVEGFSTSSCRATFIRDSLITGDRCIEISGAEVELTIDGSQFLDCGEMTATGLNAAYITDTLFNRTGVFVGNMLTGATGVFHQCTFQDPTTTAMDLVNSWSLQAVTVQTSRSLSSSAVEPLVKASGTLSVEGCSFVGPNVQSHYTGPAIQSTSDLTMKNTNFENLRSANAGGAVYSQGLSVSVENCVFRNVYSFQNGGAMRLESSSSVISSCTFENAVSHDRGGAIYVSGAVNVTGCTFSDCSSLGDAGGLYLNRLTDVNIENTMFSNCSSSAIVLGSNSWAYNIWVSHLMFDHCYPNSINCQQDQKIYLNDTSTIRVNGKSSHSDIEGCHIYFTYAQKDDPNLLPLFILLILASILAGFTGCLLRQLKLSESPMSAY